MLEFTVYGKPQQMGSKSTFIPKGAKFPIVTDQNKNLKPWKDSILAAARDARPKGFELIDGPSRIWVEFRFLRPKSHYGAKGLKASAPHWYANTPDWDKLCRALCDALTGVIYRDDKLVASSSVDCIWVESDPGAKVRIEELPATMRAVEELSEESLFQD